MSKICFITLGDMEKVPTAKRATGMASELVRLGHRVAIVAWDVPANHARLAMECPEAEPLWVAAGSWVGEIVNKIKVVRGWRPDLIYQTAFTFRNLACLKSVYGGGARVIAEQCELYSAFGKPQYRRGLKWLEDRSFFEADGLVCASRYLQNEFDRRIACRRGSAKTVYLPYAYPDYLLPETLPNGRSAAKRILFMAALWKNYGVLDVIRAAKRLAKKRTDFVVEIVGAGPARDEAARLIDEQEVGDRVVLRGFVPEQELNHCFSQASVFLVPLYDTVQDVARCPSKVYYYLPYQKPIVTCALGEPHELLQEDGFYYTPGDVSAMAECLGRALDGADRFTYRHVRLDEHTWRCRARQFDAWCRGNGWLP